MDDVCIDEFASDYEELIEMDDFIEDMDMDCDSMDVNFNGHSDFWDDLSKIDPDDIPF